MTSRASTAAEDYEDLFENAPCGYLVVAIDGRILAANATLAGWIETPASQLHGRSLRDLLTTTARIFYETSFAPLLRLQGGFEEVALELSRTDGGKLPVLVNARERRGPAGEVVGVRITFVRAAQRLGYERDLKSREASSAQALLDEQSSASLREQFIAVLGHDLRNPLASVSSGVSLLQRNPSKEMADRIAGMMRASIVRMTDLIDNVLDFARGRLGSGIDLRRGPTDLEAVIVQVVEELQAGHSECAIQVRCSLPALVDCDGPRMSQMVSNLVGNACAHGDHATPIRVEAYVHGTYLEVAIANGGEVIPEARLATLFEPFSRGTDRAPRAGLGLGLFIASEIARAHGGDLSVVSIAAETVFTFRMLLTTAQGVAPLKA